MRNQKFRIPDSLQQIQQKGERERERKTSV